MNALVVYYSQFGNTRQVAEAVAEVFRGAGAARALSAEQLTAAKRIDRKLGKLGGKRLLPPETFYVQEHHEGLLYDGELERARRWAASILARLDGRR